MRAAAAIMIFLGQAGLFLVLLAAANAAWGVDAACAAVAAVLLLAPERKLS